MVTKNLVIEFDRSEVSFALRLFLKPAEIGDLLLGCCERREIAPEKIDEILRHRASAFVDFQKQTSQASLIVGTDGTIEGARISYPMPEKSDG